jgi:voltage-gated potassium channel
MSSNTNKTNHLPTKEDLIERINQIDNPSELLRLCVFFDNENIDEEEINEGVDEYSKMIDEVLAIYKQKDEPLLIRQELPSISKLQAFENRFAPLMFWFSIVMLMLMGFIIMFSFSEEARFLVTPLVLWQMTILYGILMVVPLLEFLYVIHLKNKEHLKVSIYQLTFRAVTIPLMPLRMGARRLSDNDWLWIPFWKWSKCNDVLLDELKRKFSLPMIGIALLIIPILFIDLNKTLGEQVAARVPDIRLYLEGVQAFIWIAFTFEFILMFSVTRDKLDYCKANWIDLFIILLPLVSFLRTFRAIQGIARVNQLARAYRFRGVITKVREALVLADLVQRIMYPNPESQLRALQKKIQKNRREKIHLEKQVEMSVRRIKKFREKKELKKQQKAQMKK